MTVQVVKMDVGSKQWVHGGGEVKHGCTPYPRHTRAHRQGKGVHPSSSYACVLKQ